MHRPEGITPVLWEGSYGRHLDCLPVNMRLRIRSELAPLLCWHVWGRDYPHNVLYAAGL